MSKAIVVDQQRALMDAVHRAPDIASKRACLGDGLFDILLDGRARQNQQPHSSEAGAAEMVDSMMALLDPLQESGLSKHDQNEILEDVFRRWREFVASIPGVLSTDDWTDQEFVRSALALWTRFWLDRESDAQAERGMCAVLDRAYARSTPWRKRTGSRIALFCAWWAHDAFTKLVTSHTYAAALMATAAGVNALEDLELHWRAFQVVVPNGLLRVGDVDLTRIALCVSADGRASLSLYSPREWTEDGEGHVGVFDEARTLADLLGDPKSSSASAVDDRPEGFESATPIQERLLVLAKRLAAGLLLAIQHRDNVSEKRQAPTGSKGRMRSASEPPHRVVYVGKPLRLDCRPAIARWLETGRSSRGRAAPAVQVLVIGHHKRQVVGVGRRGRKVIWIKPYWRGPDGAPILSRPRSVGSEDVATVAS